MNRAKIITVRIEAGDAGLLHATSPEMGELFVSGESVEEIHEAVPEVIKAIFAAHGKSVSVYEADADDLELPMPWVILANGDHHASC